MFAALLGITLWLRLLARQMSMCEDGTSYSGGRNIHPGEKKANRESARSQTPIQQIASPPPHLSHSELLLSLGCHELGSC